jgi:hypothetical protein
MSDYPDRYATEATGINPWEKPDQGYIYAIAFFGIQSLFCG